MASPALKSTVEATRILRPSASVVAAEPARRALSPNDWTMPSFFSIGLLFFYDTAAWRAAHPDRAAEEFMPATLLADALEHVLQSYPLLGGRFEMTPDACAEVVHVDAGAPFVTRRCDATLDSLPLSVAAYTGPTALPPGLTLISEQDWTVPAWSPNQPAFDVTHTRFACGGVCLGVRMHHWLADAEAYFGLVADWAEITRAMSAGDRAPKLRVQPSLDRTFLWPTQQQRDEALAPSAFVPQLYRVTPPIVGEAAASAAAIETAKPTAAADASAPAAADAAEVVAPLPAIARVFRFERSELAALKEAATAAAGGAWVSTFEALTAHLYRCVYRARFPDKRASSVAMDAQQIDLILAHNWRKSLAACPAKYFGNAALGVPVKLRGDLLRRQSLAATAQCVHDAIAAQDESLVRRTLAFVSVQAKKDAIPVAPVTGLLTISQWNKQPMYTAAAFESPAHGGVPVRVCLPHVPAFDGMAITFGTPEGQGEDQSGGAIDLLVALAGDAMQRLEKDAGWREFREGAAKASAAK